VPAPVAATAASAAAAAKNGLSKEEFLLFKQWQASRQKKAVA
jgi:hypothetical protein